jgi:hypothetical protein
MSRRDHNSQGASGLADVLSNPREGLTRGEYGREPESGNKTLTVIECAGGASRLMLRPAPAEHRAQHELPRMTLRVATNSGSCC